MQGLKGNLLRRSYVALEGTLLTQHCCLVSLHTTLHSSGNARQKALTPRQKTATRTQTNAAPRRLPSPVLTRAAYTPVIHRPLKTHLACMRTRSYAAPNESSAGRTSRKKAGGAPGGAPPL